MVQIGSGLSGFALFALFSWLPIWRLAVTETPDGLFRYFVVVMSLVFGVFMVSSGRSSFSFMRMVPALVAGGLASAGYASSTWWMFFAGLFGVGFTYLAMGE
jgi:hypothetical protein